MSAAYFRFHGELTFFLARHQRQVPLKHTFHWRASIKDMIEAIAPPHCEVAAIMVDGDAVDFDYIVQPETYIDVYDHISAGQLSHTIALRPAMEGKPSFVLDTHLGRLSSYLRMLGFDTLYRNDYADDTLAKISADENRILLTRDLGVLKRSIVTYGRFMRETQPRAQVMELMERYALAQHVEPFRHCLRCNGRLAPVDKACILDQLTQSTAAHYDEFHQCQSCAQIYWKGSHYDHMRGILSEFLRGE